MSFQFFPNELQSVPVLTAMDLQEVLSCSDSAFDRLNVYSPTEHHQRADALLKERQHTGNLMAKLMRLEQQQQEQQQRTIAAAMKPEDTTVSMLDYSRQHQSKRLSTGDISFLEALLSTDSFTGSAANRPDRLELYLNELGQPESSSASISTTPSSPPTPTDTTGCWSACGRDEELIAYDDDACSSGASSPLSMSDPVFKQLLDDVSGPPCTEITDAELTQLTVKELNRRLKNMDSSLAQRLKQRRRLLKNRGYAQTCRSRRIKQQKSLTKQNDSLATKISSLQSKCDHLGKERDEYKKKYENLLLFVGKSS